jgi:hypothetical protein
MAKHDYFICPVCGTEVPVKALACPECGSDESTGWSEDTMYDDLGLEFFDEPEPETPSFFLDRRVMVIIAIVALLIFLAFLTL